MIEKLKPLGPLMVGLGGFVVLASLGKWQLDRLAWKNDLLASIEQRISAPSIALPPAPDAKLHDYLPVTVTGSFDAGKRVNFLASKGRHGPGYDLISAFKTETGRRILIDRGYAPMDVQATLVPPTGTVEVTGLLRWPDDKNAFVPEPDLPRMEWYSKDVPSMANALSTEPVLLVARTSESDTWPEPRAQRITLPNNHRSYAITWFGLALVWAAMSVFWAYSARKPKDNTIP